jgi:hypothetical protein
MGFKQPIHTQTHLQTSVDISLHKQFECVCGVVHGLVPTVYAAGLNMHAKPLLLEKLSSTTHGQSLKKQTNKNII